MNKVGFDLSRAEGRDAYKLLTGLIIPRPIGWIGTRSADGRHNLAPFSFFNLLATDPPWVMFSGGSHADRPKDSVTAAIETGEYTVNLVSHRLAPAMAVSAGRYGPDDDEFEIAGLTAVPGTVVAAPLVGESPANLECRVVRVIEVGAAVRMVIGEVVMIHVDGDALDGTRIRPEVLDAVGRIAGAVYVTTRDRFEATG